MIREVTVSSKPSITPYFESMSKSAYAGAVIMHGMEEDEVDRRGPLLTQTF